MAENEELTYDLDLEEKLRRNFTKKKELQRRVSDETKVMCNLYEILVEKKRSDLMNYIGVIVRERDPIICDN